MKIRLLPLLICACFITAAFTGCKSDSADTDGKTAELATFTNVYGVKEISISDNHSINDSSAHLRGGRICMFGSVTYNGTDYEPAIFSVDENGDDYKCEPYTGRNDGATVTCITVAANGECVYIENVYDRAAGVASQYLVKGGTDGSNVFSIEIKDRHYPENLIPGM